MEKDAAVYVMYSEIRWFIAVNNEFLRINWGHSINLTPSKSKVFASTPSPHIYLSLALPCELLISMLGRASGVPRLARALSPPTSPTMVVVMVMAVAMDEAEMKVMSQADRGKLPSDIRGLVVY